MNKKNLKKRVIKNNCFNLCNSMSFLLQILLSGKNAQTIIIKKSSFSVYALDAVLLQRFTLETMCLGEKNNIFSFLSIQLILVQIYKSC